MNLFSAFNGSDDDNDDQDVEVALVCPTQTLEGLNDKKDKVEKDNKKDGVYKRAKRKFISETAQFVVSLFVLTVVLGLVVISYFFCLFSKSPLSFDHLHLPNIFKIIYLAPTYRNFIS